VPDDAAAICDVLRRSIVELCTADHQDDPAVLARWLANKTPESVGTWIANPVNRLLVAVIGESIVATGCVTTTGEIILNYVSPDTRFRGVSRALMRALETQARQDGNTTCRLDSTVTALRFYLSAGYERAGPEAAGFGMISYPMTKAI